MTLGRVILFGVMITQDQCVRSLLTAFSVNGWARQEIFWLKLMIKAWKINISFHASREAEFKELINGVYSAIKIHYRFTRFSTKTRSWKPNNFIMEYAYAGEVGSWHMHVD